MIGLLIALVILVAIVSAVLHVSAGVAWGIVIAAFVALIAYQVKYGSKNATMRKRTKTGVLFSTLCPECRKHVKPNATRCNHCGAPLVEAIPQAPPEAITSAAVRFCPGCGAKVTSVTAAHCERCGTALVIPQRR